MSIVVESSAVPLPGVALRSPVEVPSGTRIRDLLQPGDVADGDMYLMPVVNGESTNLDRVLCDGDRLRLFRLSSGG